MFDEIGECLIISVRSENTETPGLFVLFTVRGGERGGPCLIQFGPV